MEPEILSELPKSSKKLINGHAPEAILRQKKSRGRAPEARAGEVFALMGFFLTPGELLKACETLRDAGYQRFDAHTPFPVHGLDQAMGLRSSRLPWVVLGGGLFGLGGSVLLAWYTQAVDYPLNISGKEAFSYQAYIPVFFELTVLCAALACFFGMWIMNRLPRFFHPTLTHPSFHRATDDAFFISVEAADPQFDLAETRRLLGSLGARELSEVSP